MNRVLEILKVIFKIYSSLIKELAGIFAKKAKVKINEIQEQRQAEIQKEKKIKEELKGLKFPPKKSKTYVILTEIGILLSTSIYICGLLALFAALTGSVRNIAAFSFMLPYAAFIVALIFIFEVIILIPTYSIEYRKYKKGFFEPEDFEKTFDDKFTEFYTSFSIVVLFILAYIWIKYFRPEI